MHGYEDGGGVGNGGCSQNDGRNKRIFRRGLRVSTKYSDGSCWNGGTSEDIGALGGREAFYHLIHTITAQQPRKRASNLHSWRLVSVALLPRTRSSVTNIILDHGENPADTKSSFYIED